MTVSLVWITLLAILALPLALKDFHPLALWSAGRRTVGLFAFLQKKNGVFIIFQNGTDGKKQERVRRWEQNGFEGMNSLGEQHRQPCRVGPTAGQR